MICPNCNAENMYGSKYCIKCGNILETVNPMNGQASNINNQMISANSNIQPSQPISANSNIQLNQPMSANSNIQPNQSIINNPQQMTSTSNIKLNYLKYIVGILFKPFKQFKEEENKFYDTKTAIIFSLIVSGIMMLIELVTSMISAIFVKTMDYSVFQYKTTIEFSNLKNLDYLSLIGKNLLIYAGIIIVIALVYYLAGLVLKKTVNFIKLLSISATSILPYIVLGMIVSPLIGKIWLPLSIVAMVIGIVYSIIIFLNLINDEFKFDNVDTKIYFYVICFSILGVAGYYLYVNLLMSGVSTDINDILNMFG